MIITKENKEQYFLNEILEIDEKRILSAKVINYNPFYEHLIYINTEKILRSTIKEFENASETIYKNIFGKAIEIYESIIHFGLEHPQVSANISAWKMSEGTKSFGYFGSKQMGVGGRALGAVKKKEFALAFGKFIFEQFKAINNEDYQKARLLNASSVFVPGVDVDNISDMLIISLREEFVNFTDRIINELEIDETKYFVLKNGKKLLKLCYFDSDKMKDICKLEYFYPEEFFSEMPLADKNDMSIWDEDVEEKSSMEAIKQLFNIKKEKLLENIYDFKKQSPIDIKKIEELLDFRFFISAFRGESKIDFRSDKDYVVGLFNEIKKSNDVSALEAIDKNIEIVSNILKNFNWKFVDVSSGKLEIKEEEVHWHLYATLQSRFIRNVYNSPRTAKNDIPDFVISQDNIDYLIELKVIDTSSRIGEVVSKYSTQIDSYLDERNYDQVLYLIVAANLSKDEILDMVDGLEEVNRKRDKNFIKYKIITANKKISASKMRSEGKFIPDSIIIANRSDAEHAEFLSVKQVMEIQDLQKKYYEISGRITHNVLIDEINLSILETEKMIDKKIEAIINISDKFSEADLRLNNLKQLEDLHKEIKRFNEIDKKINIEE